MFRAASRRWSCATRACRKLCRSFADLYSAFSRRSPCSRALEDLLGQVHPELEVEPLDLVLEPLLEIDHLCGDPPAPTGANVR